MCAGEELPAPEPSKPCLKKSVKIIFVAVAGPPKAWSTYLHPVTDADVKEIAHETDEGEAKGKGKGGEERGNRTEAEEVEV